MEEIFVNKTVCTDKEYKIFLKSYQKEFARTDLLYILFNIIFFGVCSILLFINQDYLVGSVIIIGIILYVILKRKRNQKIAKEQNKKVQEKFTNDYIFYNRNFAIKTKEGKANIWYFKIYRIVETEKYFYIYLNRKYAYIIAKDGFTKGEGKDFGEFIKRKTFFKYRNRMENK